MIAAFPALFGCGGVANATSFAVRARSCDLLHRREVGLAARHVDGEDQRAVETRPEALDEQVVGAPCGVRRGPVAGVGEREAHRQHRRRQHQEDDETGDRPRPRAALDDSAPPVPERLAELTLGALLVGQAELVDVAAYESQDRRKQSDCGEHGHQDAERDADREAAHRGHVDQQHPEHGDDDGRAGEHDRATRGVGRERDCALGLMAVAERLPVARDDEQGVVDADPDPDHRDRLGREVGHRQAVRAELHERDTRTDSKQRGHDRQSGGEDGTERDQQHHDREEHADRLARRQLLVTEELSAELDAQAGDVDLLGFGLDLVGRVLEVLVRTIGEVDLGVGDAAVLRDLARVRGVVRADDLRARHGALDASEQVLHRPLDVRIVHPPSCLEHDLSAETGAVGEARDPRGTAEPACSPNPRARTRCGRRRRAALAAKLTTTRKAIHAASTRQRRR